MENKRAENGAVSVLESPAPPTATATTTKRVTVNFAIPTYRALEAIAERKGITVSEALRQAIKLSDYLERAIEEGGKILIDRQGTINELLIR